MTIQTVLTSVSLDWISSACGPGSFHYVMSSDANAAGTVDASKGCATVK